MPATAAAWERYLATTRAEFRSYFDAHRVQLPLVKGNAVFFNPALFHAAGSNLSSDVRRIANLLQISSAYGRAMESVDRLKMSLALYPALRRLVAAKAVTAAGADNAIAASAEGYAFPTNLDRDPPIGGHGAQEPAGIDATGPGGRSNAGDLCRGRANPGRTEVDMKGHFADRRANRRAQIALLDDRVSAAPGFGAARQFC